MDALGRTHIKRHLGDPVALMDHNKINIYAKFARVVFEFYGCEKIRDLPAYRIRIGEAFMWLSLILMMNYSNG